MAHDSAPPNVLDLNFRKRSGPIWNSMELRNNQRISSCPNFFSSFLVVNNVSQISSSPSSFVSSHNAPPSEAIATCVSNWTLEIAERKKKCASKEHWFFSKEKLSSGSVLNHVIYVIQSSLALPHLKASLFVSGLKSRGPVYIGTWDWTCAKIPSLKRASSRVESFWISMMSILKIN